MLANGSVYPRKGRLWAVARQVDVQTGAINLQVQFPNPGNVLRPGGFGSVRTVVSVQHDASLVPQRAVTDVQGTYMVAVVGSDNKVTVRIVKPGPRTGSMWVIEDGVKPGERVVAEGVQKVKDGTLVIRSRIRATRGRHETPSQCCFTATEPRTVAGKPLSITKLCLSSSSTARSSRW